MIDILINDYSLFISGYPIGDARAVNDNQIIAFFEENSKYLINDVLINFEKLENVQLAMSSFFNFQNAKDKLNPIIPEELGFFDNLEELKETEDIV